MYFGIGGNGFAVNIGVICRKFAGINLFFHRIWGVNNIHYAREQLTA
jgi:hypothetical protein